MFQFTHLTKLRVPAFTGVLLTLIYLCLGADILGSHLQAVMYPSGYFWNTACAWSTLGTQGGTSLLAPGKKSAVFLNGPVLHAHSNLLGRKGLWR